MEDNVATGFWAGSQAAEPGVKRERAKETEGCAAVCEEGCEGGEGWDARWICDKDFGRWCSFREERNETRVERREGGEARLEVCEDVEYVV